VIFRADSLETASNIFKAMLGLNGIVFPEVFNFMNKIAGYAVIHIGQVYEHINGKTQTTAYLIIALIVVLRFKNATELAKSFKPTLYNLVLSFLYLTISFSMLSQVSEFLYFNF
jgi:hypothetical protein